MKEEKKEQPEWVVELAMDYAKRTYTNKRIGLAESYGYMPEHCLKVQADDEIGAFHAAHKILKGIGFAVDYAG